MSLWKIAWRSIQQRALASSLTAFSVALGVSLVVAVLVAQKVIRDSFTRGASGYHLVVGKKGSQLQLVLNTVYHLQDPIENIPYSYYKRLTNPKDSLGKYVKTAIPYCLGDNYDGFRVVGTIPDLFTKLEYADGQKYEFESGGRNFKANQFYEAVIGSTVARVTGLKVGKTFQPVHGLSDSDDGHKHDAFKVVGILKPTGTANDRALFINIEGFYRLDNHAKPLEDVAAAKAEKAAKAAHDEHEGHEHAEGEPHDHDAHDHDAHEHDDAKAPAGKVNSPHGQPGHVHSDDEDKAPAEKPKQADEHADHDHAAGEPHDHDDAKATATKVNPPHGQPGHVHSDDEDKAPADKPKVTDEHGDHDHVAGEPHDHGDTKAPATKVNPPHGQPGHVHSDDEDHEGHDHAAHDHDDAKTAPTKVNPPHGQPGHVHSDDEDHEGHDHAGHDHAGHAHSHEPLPEDQREVTAVLVLAKGSAAMSDISAGELRRLINKGDEAQAAMPVRVIADFFQKIVQTITIALLGLTVLIIVVSGIGVMVSIYNSMNDRRRDIAVMRALGAARGTVLSVILVESILLSVGGGLLGMILGHALVALLGPTVERLAGVSLGFFQFDKYELVLIPALVVLASLVGYLPALSAYRTDVAKALSASP